MACIQTAYFLCNTCIPKDLNYPVFTDQDSLVNYANPKDTSCLTKVHFCKHQLCFSRPGVCILLADHNQHKYIILSHAYLYNYGIYHIEKNCEEDKYFLIGRKNGYFNHMYLENINYGAIIEDKHHYANAVIEQTKEIYYLEKLFDDYYIVTTNTLTKRAV